MKQSRTVISAIVVVAVLLTALGLTSCSKKKAQKSGSAESKTGTEPKKSIEAQKRGDPNELETERPGIARTRAERRRGPSRFGDEMRERWQNMSEEERRAMRERMRERFGGRRGEGGRGGERGRGGRGR